jgi:hypothetical protein
MSNFDHRVEDGAEALLRANPDGFGQYSGWDFCGSVWHDPLTDVFLCEVWTYGAPWEVLGARTLDEIMSLVSDKYGWD